MIRIPGRLNSERFTETTCYKILSNTPAYQPVPSSSLSVNDNSLQIYEGYQMLSIQT